MFKTRKDYIIACIQAAVGTLLDENYFVQDFENLIGHETPEQSVCTSFISYIKTSKQRETALQYTSRTNFNDYLLTRKNNEALTDRENGLIDILFSRITYNKENNNAELKDPDVLIKQLSEARKKIDLAKSLQGLSENEQFSQDPVTWSDKYCEELRNSVSDATDTYENSDENVILSGDSLSQYYEQKIEDRKNGETYSFHSPMLDALITEGPTPGHGGIIGGSTGMGKSALCLNIINDMIDADLPVMYFPIEMGVENTLDRLTSIRTGIPFKEIRNIGKKENQDLTALEQGVKQVTAALRAHTNFAIIPDANITLKKLRNYIRKFQAKLPGRKYCVVFIDLLLMIKEFYDEGSNMAQMIERAINKLDILAKELGIHYVGVVQLNRTIEADKVLSVQSIEKLRPTRAAIKNSSALLERARWAITVFRKKYFADLYLGESEANTVTDDIVEVQLMKANDEAISRKYMTFNGPTFKMVYNPTYNQSANGF